MFYLPPAAFFVSFILKPPLLYSCLSRLVTVWRITCVKPSRESYGRRLGAAVEMWRWWRMVYVRHRAQRNKTKQKTHAPTSYICVTSILKSDFTVSDFSMNCVFTLHPPAHSRHPFTHQHYPSGHPFVCKFVLLSSGTLSRTPSRSQPQPGRKSPSPTDVQNIQEAAANKRQTCKPTGHCLHLVFVSSLLLPDSAPEDAFRELENSF